MPHRAPASRHLNTTGLALDDTTAALILARAAAAQARARRRLPRPTPTPTASTSTSTSAGPTARQRRGAAAEAQAARYLERHGLRILARNLRWQGGEIDLVAADGATLVFVEVRLRARASHGGARASIGPQKIRRIVRTAARFLDRLSRTHFGGRLPACRFDVIGIENGRLHWIRAAFTALDASAP